MITTVCPNSGFAHLNPFRAIDAIVENDASFKSTPSGTFATRFLGIEILSACHAYSAPAHATLSPILKSFTSSDISSTMPAEL